MNESDDFLLSSVYYEDSDKRVPGFLHDYAYCAQALLAVAGKVDWLEAGASSEYIDKAKVCYGILVILVMFLRQVFIIRKRCRSTNCS